MSKADEARAREQRLAAKLRENLKRRKVAARAAVSGDADADAAPAKPSETESDTQ